MVALATKRFGAFLARAGIAAVVIAVLNWLFNYPFTVFVVSYFDLIPGVLFWTSAGLILNYACIAWYKRTDKDWFGLEWLRMQGEIESDNIYAKLIRWGIRHSQLLAFGLISLFMDPIYGFMYYRGRKSGKNFDLADWWWFVLANVIGGLPWIMGGYGGLEIIVIVGDVLQKAAE
jgi:hypothetical protein